MSVTIEDTSFDDSGAIKTVMVNTNQVSILHNLISGFSMLVVFLILFSIQCSSTSGF